MHFHCDCVQQTAQYFIAAVLLLVSALSALAFVRARAASTFAGFVLHISTDLLFHHSTFLVVGEFAAVVCESCIFYSFNLSRESNVKIKCLCMKYPFSAVLCAPSSSTRIFSSPRVSYFHIQSKCYLSILDAFV